jgi:DNA polymerase-1
MALRPSALISSCSNRPWLTLAQAEAFCERFFKAYPDVAAWQATVKQRRVYESRMLSGRRRRWCMQPPMTERLNMPVQGTGADILKQALGLLPAALKETGVRIIATVHDEIVLEAPETKAQDVAARLKTIMTEAGQTSMTRMPIEAEVGHREQLDQAVSCQCRRTTIVLQRRCRTNP